MPKSIEREEKEKRSLKLFCFVAFLPACHVRLHAPSGCPLPIASCQLPFWGANPFKFCLMSLNCCRCTSQAALRVSLSPPSLPLCVLCNVAASACNLYKCPKLSKMSVRMSRTPQLLWPAPELIALCDELWHDDELTKVLLLLQHRQTDSPEVAAVPAQVINTHVKGVSPRERESGGE